jgi:hypothetical protein
MIHLLFVSAQLAEMYPHRFAILIFIVTAIIVGYVFNFPKESRNFCLANAVLCFEVFDFFMTRPRSKNVLTFKVWSTQWMFGLGFAALLVFSFSDDSMDLWNVFAISETVVYAALFVARNRFTAFQVESDGIFNLNKGELIAYSTITAITINDTEIVIDTMRYRNELVIKADVLYSSTWGELVSNFPNLKGGITSMLLQEKRRKAQ